MTVVFFIYFFEASVDILLKYMHFHLLMLSYQYEFINGLLHQLITWFPRMTPTEQYWEESTDTRKQYRWWMCFVLLCFVLVRQKEARQDYLKYFIPTLHDSSYRTEHLNKLLSELTVFCVISSMACNSMCMVTYSGIPLGQDNKMHRNLPSMPLV